MTLPLWLYGGNGNNNLIGGAGNNVIVGGSGQNTLQSSNGVNTPQTIDDSDTTTTFPGLENYFQDTGSWSSATEVAGAFNGEEVSDVANTGTDTAAWTFAYLDPSGYYDVYVTWSPVAGDSTAAQYTVLDGTTPIEPLGADLDRHGQPGPGPGRLPGGRRILARPGRFPGNLGHAGRPAWHGRHRRGPGRRGDDRAARNSSADEPDHGQFWNRCRWELFRDLHDHRRGFPALQHRHLWLAGRVQPATLPSDHGYMVPGEGQGVRAACCKPTRSTIRRLLAGGGQTYTVSFAADLSGDSSPYLIAMLDCNDEVAETNKDDNLSAALAGAFQNSDGGLYVLASDGVNQTVTFSQDPSSGTTTVTIDGSPQQFTNVSSVYVGTGSGNDTIDASGLTVPLTAYAGSGTDTIIGGQANNEIYGGSGFDTLDGSERPEQLDSGRQRRRPDHRRQRQRLAVRRQRRHDHHQRRPGNEVIHGGAGTNYLNGGSGLDEIYGGTGTNFICGYGVHDLLQGGPVTIISCPAAAAWPAWKSEIPATGLPTRAGSMPTAMPMCPTTRPSIPATGHLSIGPSAVRTRGFALAEVQPTPRWRCTSLGTPRNYTCPAESLGIRTRSTTSMRSAVPR